MVCCQLTLWGEASSSRLPGIIPAGYVSQTGYQYDSISRVAGHRELAPPSKFSKLGGFNSNVFITSGILHPQPSLYNLGRFRELGSALKARNGRSARTRIARPPQSVDNSLPDFVVSPQTFLPVGLILHQKAKCHRKRALQGSKGERAASRARLLIGALRMAPHLSAD